MEGGLRPHRRAVHVGHIERRPPAKRCSNSALEQRPRIAQPLCVPNSGLEEEGWKKPNISAGQTELTQGWTTARSAITPGNHQCVAHR